MKKTTKFYGLDLGNSNTGISVFDDETQKPSPVFLAGLSYGASGTVFNYPEHLIPTVIAIGNEGNVYFGAEALQQEKTTLYKDIKKNALEGRYYKKTPFAIFNQAPNLLKLFLNKVVSELWKIEGKPFTLSISHPATVAVMDGTAYKELLNTIIEDLPKHQLEKVILSEEPYAASIGYNVFKEEKNKLIFVLDFGSCTINTVILVSGRMEDNIIATYTEFFGGRRVDFHLLEYVNERFFEGRIDRDSPDYPTLLEQCEEAKVHLSEQDNISFAFRNKNIEINKTDFDFRVLKDNGFVDDMQRVLDHTLDIAISKGRQKAEIAYVIFTGGSSLIPSVKQQVEEYFSFDGHKILNNNPFLAVTEGLAVIASGRQALKELRFDFFVGSFNPKAKSNNWLFRICSAGEKYPSSKIRAFYIEPANLVMYDKPQDELELVFYYSLPTKDADMSVVGQAPAESEKYIHLIQANAEHQFLGVELKIQSKQSKKLQANYFVNHAGCLCLSVTDFESHEYTTMKLSSGKIAIVKDLAIAELD